MTNHDLDYSDWMDLTIEVIGKGYAIISIVVFLYTRSDGRMSIIDNFIDNSDEFVSPVTESMNGIVDVIFSEICHGELIQLMI